MLAASETRLSESQEALYPLLVNRKPRIDMNSFRDLYDVDKDLAIVREIEEKIKERNRKEGVPESSLKAGEHFELVVDFAIDEIGILGKNATSKRSSRFDDIIGGIDGYVEFEEEGMTSHLALAMDVTRNTDDISKKFLRNRTSIDSGELFTGKYYKSEAAHFRGELGHVVRVILGADQETIDSISDLITRSLRLSKTIKENREKGAPQEISAQAKKNLEKINGAIGEHPLQWVVLLEIQQQLEVYQVRAEKKNQLEVAEKCRNILIIINAIIAEKKKAGQAVDDEVLLKDRVFQLIKAELKSF